MKQITALVFWAFSSPAFGFISAVTDPEILKPLEYGAMLFLDNPGVDESGGLYGTVKNVILLETITVPQGSEDTYFYQATYQALDYEHGDPIEEREVNCKTKILVRPSGPHKRLKTLCDYVPQQYKELDIYNQDWDESPWAI
jgi:hypothetical protein